MGANKNKVTGRVGFINRKTYNEFIKDNPTSTITYENFIKVLKESSIVIRDYVLNNELGFKLPYELGYIAVDKFKPSKSHISIDWVNTKRFGKKIPLTNLHSFGNVYKVKLYKNPKIKPLMGYKMTAHRILKRLIAQKVKSGKARYIPLETSYFGKRFNINNYLNSPKRTWL